MATNERVKKVAEKRPQRTPLHKQKVMTTLKRKGYVRRWVNIKEDRIERFKRAGWSGVAVDQLDLDANTHAVERNEDSLAIRNVGGGVQSMLMEIPQEYYEEDQKEKQNRVDEIERAYSPHLRAKKESHLYEGEEQNF